MKKVLSQGDIIRIEGIKNPVYVASKDFFNSSGLIVGCPVFETGISTESPLHILIETDTMRGKIQCEKLRTLDISIRGYKRISSVSVSDRINISDAIQGIFDYV